MNVFLSVLQVETDEEENVFEELMPALLQELSQVGEVVLVRFVEDTMWVTFRDGQTALAAAKKANTQVRPFPLRLLLVKYNKNSRIPRSIVYVSRIVKWENLLKRLKSYLVEKFLYFFLPAYPLWIP